MRKPRPWHWYPGYWFAQVTSYIRYDIHQGFYGLYVWARFAWRWRPWDFGYILPAIDLHLKHLAPVLRTGLGAEGEKRAREVEIARRLIALTDIEHVGGSHKLWLRQRAREGRAWSRLWRLIGHRGSHWWD